MKRMISAAGFTAIVLLTMTALGGAAVAAPPVKGRAQAPVRDVKPPPVRDAFASASTHWSNPKVIESKFEKHGADFGAKTPSEYAVTAAREAYRAEREKTPAKYDPHDARTRTWDSATNVMTVQQANNGGKVVTAYKPDPAKHGLPTNSAYWNSTKGVLKK